MPSTESPLELVQRFCSLWEANDLDGIVGCFADDAVYHNIPMDPAVGIDATIAFITGFFAMCESIEFEVVHLAVRDRVVLTERIDTFTVGQVVAPLPVMGTFEVRDGKISAWRDYFDMAQVTKVLSGDA